MPKVKTKRSAMKRLKVTSKGKIMRMKAFKSHLLSKKTRKRKRNLRKASVVTRSDKRKLRPLIPYLF